MRPIVLLLFVWPACEKSAAGPDAAPLVDAADPAGRVGDIWVTELARPWGTWSSALARFSTTGFPGYHTETMNDGTCQLLTYQVGNCLPACTGFCVAPAECRPFPTYVEVGTLALSGLKDSFTMYYYGGGYAPQNATAPDIFDDGDVVGASATGGALPAFQVEARGVAPLSAAISGDRITLVDGADYVFRWTPAPPGSVPARVRVTINANNAGHGAPYAAILRCEASDAAGEVRIPREMISQLPSIDAWLACAGSDCPPSTVARFTEGFVPSQGGDVFLYVGNVVEFGVVHNP